MQQPGTLHISLKNLIQKFTWSEPLGALVYLFIPCHNALYDIPKLIWSTPSHCSNHHLHPSLPQKLFFINLKKIDKISTNLRSTKTLAKTQIILAHLILVQYFLFKNVIKIKTSLFTVFCRILSEFKSCSN